MVEAEAGVVQLLALKMEATMSQQPLEVRKDRNTSPVAMRRNTALLTLMLRLLSSRTVK